MPTKIYFHQSDLFPYEPVSPILMIVYTILSYGFFATLNQMIKPMKNEQIDWLKHNTLVSFIHAAICSVFVIISVIREPKVFQDPLSHSNHFNYAIITFSAGYFLYDLVDCIVNSKTSVISFLIHHLIALVFLAYVLYNTRNIGYTIFGLAIEINSCFLHARRLFRWYSPILSSDYFNDMLRKVIDAGNYITFILFRFGIVMVSFHAIYIHRKRITVFFYTFNLLVTLAMAILNAVLFYQLIRNQSIRNERLKKEKYITDMNVVTNKHIVSTNQL